MPARYSAIKSLHDVLLVVEMFPYVQSNVLLTLSCYVECNPLGCAASSARQRSKTVDSEGSSILWLVKHLNVEDQKRKTSSLNDIVLHQLLRAWTPLASYLAPGLYALQANALGRKPATEQMHDTP